MFLDSLLTGYISWTVYGYLSSTKIHIISFSALLMITAKLKAENSILINFRMSRFITLSESNFGPNSKAEIIKKKKKLW